MLPLKNIIVLEFSQYLSGPSAGLRLADLGARVIKIERPSGGDPCRQLAIKNLWVGEDSLNFHAINRNKESFTADLKNAADLELVKKLIKKADVVTHNFRPGVMEKIGLSYADVKKINKQIVYAEVTGYGKKGPWMNKPGQDLLLQSLSGLVYTTGNSDEAPMPFGLSIVDSVCGIHTVQAILAALIRVKKTGQGAYLELSLLESAISFQFELFTTWFQNNQSVQRSRVSNGNPLLGAPYGIYKTKNGYLALAMMNIQALGQALDLEALKGYRQEEVFQKRDEIKSILTQLLLLENSDYWIEKLQKFGLWTTVVKNWNELVAEEGYRTIQAEQPIETALQKFITTRCPIQINGQKIVSAVPAPRLGQHTEMIKQELLS